MADDAVHEFKLDGKQLVFLFMAVTVVAVVVFLCGVMVGRGVPVRRGDTVLTAGGVDPTADLPPIPSTVASSTGGASAASEEDLSYTERLETKVVSPDTLAEPEAPVTEPMPDAAAQPPVAAAEKPVASPAGSVAPPAAPGTRVPPADTGASAAGGASVPTGAGWSVQVASVKGRAAAEAMVKRLGSKGYTAFVRPGAPGMFRVRVGLFAGKPDADAIASKLEKVEQFKPWVVRER